MASDYFCSDMIYEILNRAQLQTLGMCRMVCREWNHVTYQPSFTQLHCERTKTISGYFMQSSSSKGNIKHLSEFVSDNQNSSSVSDISLGFLPTPVKIEASCHQGLLFCVSQNPQSDRNLRVPKYYVCKPSTKQWQIIPNPKTKYSTEKTAIMVTRLQPLHYKIVRFSRPKERKQSREITTKQLRCEVFDSERWAWKTLNEIKLLMSGFLNNSARISASGAAHWLTYNDCIFTFDLGKEIWTISPLPKTLCGTDIYRHKDLLEYEGHIALAGILNSSKGMEVDFWVMNRKGETEEWRKRGTFDIEAFPTALYNADIAVGTYLAQAMFHKLPNHKLKKIFAPEIIFPYKSDLEPSDLRGGGK